MTISEPMSWPEIRACYPEQWVLLVDIDWLPRSNVFRTARVADHGPHLDDQIVRSSAFQVPNHKVGRFHTEPVRDSFDGLRVSCRSERSSEGRPFSERARHQNRPHGLFTGA